MVLDGGNRQYEVVREVLSGNKNDVLVCVDFSLGRPEYKTVWRVKDRELTKSLLGESVIWEECFAEKEFMYFVFPYREERSLEKFYFSTVLVNTLDKENIWLNFAVQCMTCGLPKGILYLLIKQKQAGLTPEGKVYFNYFLDLSNYREDRKERDCAMLCAGEILTLAKTGGEKAESCARLLEQKLGRKVYTEFFQLYQDLKLMADRQEKKKLINRICEVFLDRRIFFCRILCVCCIVIILSGTGAFFFQFFWGETAFQRIFGHPFEKIGTESLLQ